MNTELKDIPRLVQLAFALEPIPDKEGCTTRYKDVVDNLKLEYFIASAINIRPAVKKLVRRVSKEFPQTTYDLLMQAFVESHKNRGGKRINTGMLEMIWPILIACVIFEDKDFESILNRVKSVIALTTPEDAIWAQAACNFSYELWEGHKGRSETINLELDNVHEVYEYKRALIKGRPPYFCDEVLKGFPTLRYFDLIYDKEISFSRAQASVYKKGREYMQDLVPAGQIADLLAIYTFLLFWCYDYRVV